MSSSSAFASSSSPSPTNSDPGYFVGGPTGNGSTNSSLYLFTFLIVLIILAVISAALLFRAFFIKRRFRRRIQEAIANGQALPPDALAGLGLAQQTTRSTKGEPKIGPMPVLWEAEMYKDEIEEDGSRRTSMISKDMTRVSEKEVDWKDEPNDDWSNFTPVGMIRFPNGEPKPPTPVAPEPALPVMSEAMPRRQLLRSMFRPDRSDPLEYIRQMELAKAKAQSEIDENRTTFQVPEQGSEVVMGVMIAFPTEEGKGSDRWSVSSGGVNEEQQVPDVCLGIMQTTIGAKREQ